MNALNTYLRRNFSAVEQNVSFLGALGLGYWLLHGLRCALPLALGLVFFMACIFGR